MNSAALNDFLAHYAWLIDSDRLEEWVDLFTETTRYEVIPRENYARQLPIGLIVCENKAMLRDRVRALRNANEYNLHYDRHVIGNAKIIEQSADSVVFEANFAVFQSDAQGNGKLFTAGFYRDTLATDGPRPLIREKLVVLDIFNVPGMLATPL